MKKILVKIILFFVSFLDKLILKDEKLVVYNSFPDFSDNAFSLFLYVLKEYPDKNNIWLVKNYDVEKYKLLTQNYTDKENYKIIQRDSIIGVYYYLRAKYVFFTHGLLNGASISKKHCVVNLWHGMPLKTIGLLGNNKVVQKSSFGIATSIFYQDIMSRALNINKENILVVGQPRNDLMFQSSDCLLKLNINENIKNVILWTPTYRQSNVGDIRIDGSSTNDLPVVKIKDLEDLNTFLFDINSYMIIKLHPMDILNDIIFDNFSNIKILKKNDLEVLGCQLYSLLGSIDLLLTDFSSIYIDYLLLNKPIGFIVNDLKEYSNSRGFIFEQPTDYMPGEKISSFNDLKLFIHKVLYLKEDFFIESRKLINKKVNIESTNYSKMLLDRIKI